MPYQQQQDKRTPTQKGDANHATMSGLLFEIYERWYHKSRLDSSLESDTITEYSTSDAGVYRWTRQDTCSTGSDAEQRQPRRHNETSLRTKDVTELKAWVHDMEHKSNVISSRLVRQLKRRDHRLVRLQKKCDILTAILQASSLKRRQDTQLKFTVEPKPGEEAFQQWKDAMKAVARLPLGLPVEFRKKVWLALANHHIDQQKYDWERVRRFAFNERCNPDDHSLGIQIVKDLHRTGCERLCSEADRAALKRVLLAYARWNKRVGYCQGFNVLAALILEVMERNEDDSLKIMVYLVDHLLPESYFAQNLQALSVDMAVFRDLLHLQLPDLAKHLDDLQRAAQHNDLAGKFRRSYEPPLTNVFTMQWFLTLFATCLPLEAVLRVWDSVLLEGSEVMLRTALTIWEKLRDRIRKVDSADHFYTVMGELTQSMAEGKLVDPEDLLLRVYSIAPFPFPGLADLREKYTYNITPFSAGFEATASSTGPAQGLPGSEGAFDEDYDEEDLDPSGGGRVGTGPGCFAGILGSGPQSRVARGESANKNISADISQIGPGAVSATPSPGQLGPPGAYRERMTTNLSALQAQYQKLKHRQRKAALVINVAASSARGHGSSTAQVGNAINHLFLGVPNSLDRVCIQQQNPQTKGSSRRSSCQQGHISVAKPKMPGLIGSVAPQVQTECSGCVGPSSRTPQSSTKISRSSSATSLSVMSSRCALEAPSPTPDTAKSSPGHTWTAIEGDTDAARVSPETEDTSDKAPSDVSVEEVTSTVTTSDDVFLSVETGEVDKDTERWVGEALSHLHLRRTVGESVSSSLISPDEVSQSEEAVERVTIRQWEPAEPGSMSDSSESTASDRSFSKSPSPTPDGRKKREGPSVSLRPQLVTNNRINFGSQFGLYKALTNSAEARSSLNASIQKRYMSQLQKQMQGKRLTWN